MNSFVDVLLPLPINNSFTYSFNRKIYINISIGMRVVVPFGKNRLLTGIINKIHEEKPINYETKDIIALLDKYPITSELIIDYWKWVSNYYMCSIGDILKTSLPSTLLLEGESIISRKKSDNLILRKTTDDQFLIYEALERGPLSISDVMSIVQKKSVMPVIEEMIKMNLIDLSQKLNDKYVPKFSRYICLNEKYKSKKKQKELFENLKNSPKQFELVNFLIKDQKKIDEYVKLKDIRKKIDFSSSIIKVLLEKKILKEKILQEDRSIFNNKLKDSKLLLTEKQKVAFNQI